MLSLPKRCLLERTDDAKDLPIPKRQTQQSAGVDLHANITEAVTISKGECVLIPTGIKIALPFGYEAQIRSRSGLALNHGITVLNSPGTIDADYRGEIKVLLINHSNEAFEIKRGDRIAQMVFAKVEMMDFSEIDKLPDTQRGEDGLGSTGLSSSAGAANANGANIARGGISMEALEEFRRKKAEETLPKVELPPVPEVKVREAHPATK